MTRAELTTRLRGFLRRRWWCLVLAALLLAVPFLIEYCGGQGILPTWSELHAAFGVSLDEVPELTEGATSVAVLDVGQGDAVLIVQDGEACLIDTGLYDSCDALVSDLRAAGVETLRYVVLTHPHSDHTGGVSAVLENFPVEQILLPPWEPRDEDDAHWPYSLEDKAADNGAELVTVSAGQQFALGDGVLTVLQGGRSEDEGGDGTEEDESSDVNNASLCILFEADDFRFLDTGDAEASAERRLLDTYGSALHADLFKAGHHGSSSSNTTELLAAVRPQAVAVSCGEDNDYGHPHAEALEAFAAVGAEVYRTDRQGTIVFTWKNGALTAQTAKEELQKAA